MTDGTDVIDKTGADTVAGGGDTVAGGGQDTLAGGGKDGIDQKPTWREDWRVAMAGADEKEQKLLERMKDPSEVFKSWRAVQQKISSGELKAPATLPDKATPEQIAEYRKATGIPEKHEAYLDGMTNGVVVGEADKPLALDLAKTLHDKNLPPAAMHAAYDWYVKMQEKVAVEDRDRSRAAEDAMRVEWGAEYRANQNSIKAFMDTLAADGEGDDRVSFFNLIMSARDAEGRKLSDNPTVLRNFLHLANEANPAGFVMPGSGEGQAQSIDAEIAKIEKVMREDRPTYNKDEKMQARLRTLYTARDKLQAK